MELCLVGSGSDPAVVKVYDTEPELRLFCLKSGLCGLGRTRMIPSFVQLVWKLNSMTVIYLVCCLIADGSS